MVSSGDKSKTDSIAWVLLQVYYQTGNPFPVFQLKKEKLVLHEFHYLKSNFRRTGNGISIWYHTYLQSASLF